MPQLSCRKCPYFDKKKEELRRGSSISLIVGFCRLRERLITDETITGELCKDRAIVLVEDKSSEENTPAL